MKRIGLTGGIGSGKSTVASMLRDLGATVIDADAIVHELQARGSPVLDQIVQEFGPAVLAPDGELDREALGAIVFRDPDARLRLNRIVHPPVGLEMRRRMEEAEAQDVPLLVMDIPLLLEGRKAGTGTAARSPVECVVVVWVPESVQVQRTVARDGCSEDEARRRVAAQLSIDEKRQMADHVIDNSGSVEETRRQVEALYQELTGEAAS